MPVTIGLVQLEQFLTSANRCQQLLFIYFADKVAVVLLNSIRKKELIVLSKYIAGENGRL